jgi:hypothetical protein
MNLPEQPQAEEDFAARLAMQIDRVRSSEVLGRSDPLRRLFDYLASRAGSAESPKEFEIAQDALGKSGSFDVAQDASIRVYIHRLRKRLDEFYVGAPEGSDRLSIPRGSYRLVLHAAEPGAPALSAPALGIKEADPRRPARWLAWIGVAVVGSVSLGLAFAGGFLWSNLSTYPASLARTAVWEPVVRSPARTVIAVGNQAWPTGHPHMAAMGSVLALARIVPVFNALTAHPSNVPPIANVTYMQPAMLKDANIIFIGTLSQVGILSDPVFARSGFFPPDATGALTDRRSGHRYVSEPPPFTEHRQLVSYGYLASMPGPNGNRLLIISGATDGALVQMAEIASSAAELDALSAKAGNSFEALFAVQTLDSINVGSRLELVRPMRR